ncbi:hypothetical protein HK096_004343 [Nowakowskiella sp. JEL0078]|nr:hypothetical protein HK096_004343 [Nowakowskiella sp. JEL0078]
MMKRGVQRVRDSAASGFGDFSGFGGGSVRGDDISVEMNIDFMDSIKGVVKPLTYSSVQQCGTCNGSGIKIGMKASSCPTCYGSGQETFVRGGFHMGMPCRTCSGSGRYVPASAICMSCNGEGRVKERKTIQVSIPAGVEDGMSVRLSRQGNASEISGGSNGDLLVRLNVAQHPIFKREKSNLYMTTKLPLQIALLGGTIRIPTVDGDVELKIKEGTQPNSQQVLRNKGVHKMSNSSMIKSDRGDQFVTFHVEIPKRLTNSQRRLFEQAFGINLESHSTANSSSGSYESKDDHKGMFRSTIDKLFHHKEDGTGPTDTERKRP